MRNGDLSNEVVPRVLLVFEGTLGFLLQDGDRKKYDRDIRRKHWAQAADMWALNPMMCARIWDLAVRHNLTIDVVTFAGPKEFGEALADRLQEDEDLPVHQVWATRVDLLARKIAYMPDLIKVYDPDPNRWLTWGGKGQLVTRAAEVGL